MTMLSPRSQIYVLFAFMYCQTVRTLPSDEKTKVIENAIRMLQKELKTEEDSK